FFSPFLTARRLISDGQQMVFSNSDECGTVFLTNIFKNHILLYVSVWRGGSSMRLERLNQDKIRIFLTFDDLLERGINKDDIWQDIHKVHELFNDMMNQAHQELDFVVVGPVAVEV